ncbi:MAG: hypothetical protein MUC50_17800 [Myxococcota bacterium]|nr:hypothetical protein [Myxococcota bacterium]
MNRLTAVTRIVIGLFLSSSLGVLGCEPLDEEELGVNADVAVSGVLDPENTPPSLAEFDLDAPLEDEQGPGLSLPAQSLPGSTNTSAASNTSTQLPGASSSSQTAPSDRDLALRWAPILVQKFKDSRDYLATMNYDNDWNLRNNWDNLKRYTKRGASYYFVTTSSSHWFIYYGYYFPRDYDLIDSHENDMEHVLLVVHRPARGEPLHGTLDVLMTFPHGKMKKYGTPTSGFGGFGAGITMWRDPSGIERPVLRQACCGHGIESYNNDLDILELGLGRITYYPSQLPVSKIAQPRVVDRKPTTGDYALVDIFEPDGLWSHQLANDPNVFASYGNFAGDDSGECGEFNLLGTVHCSCNGANAPWNEGDGSIALDPISLVREQFAVPATFSDTYVKNPFWPDSVNYVEIFEHPAFRGRSARILTMPFYELDLGCRPCESGSNCSCPAFAPLEDNMISSIRVKNGYEAVLFTESDHSGPSFVVRSAVSNLYTFNDKVSAMIVRRASGQPIVTAYEADEYRSVYSMFFSPGRYDMNQLGTVGNDAMSSIRVSDGYEVVLYPDPGFRGAGFVVRGQSISLGRYNDVVSSLEIRQVTPTEPLVTVFEDHGLRGVYKSYYSTGSTQDFGLVGNDAITSIAVKDGYEAVLYEDGNLSGASIPVRGTVMNLEYYGFNDTVTGIRIQAARTPLAIAYEHPDHSGRYKELYALGATENLDPVGNDAMSSIIIKDGYEAVLYENINDSGASLPVRGSVPDLGYYRFDDTVTGILLQSARKPIATVFENADYSGRYKEFYTSGSTENLDPMGNDAMTSIVVTDGYEAVLYENGGYSGASIPVRGSVANLGYYRFNDTATGIRIQGARTPLAIVYEHPNYSGRYKELYSLGAPANLDPVGTDAISSVRVAQGHRLTLFDRRGYFAPFHLCWDTPDLMNFNDRAGSLSLARWYEESCSDSDGHVDTGNL